MNKKMTITDLASRTGFSPATISRVLNHKDLVNAETYDKIIAVIKDTGYQPLQSFSPPTTENEKRILVVNVSDVSNSFYAKIFKGIRSAALNYGWYVMINQEPINDLTLKHFLKILKSCNAIGLIALDLVGPSVLDALIDILPVVQCCEFNPSARAPYIGIDNYAATVALMEYLILQGHQNIAIINGPMQLKSEYERQRGYEAALEHAGIALDPDNMIRLPSSEYFIAHTTVLQLLQSSQIPDAIFAASDVLAYAAVIAAKECHLAIPKDISIFGFDNISLSEMSIPKISTVNHPCFEIGYLSGEMIYKQCLNPRKMPKNVFLNTELILRESTR